MAEIAKNEYTVGDEVREEPGKKWDGGKLRVDLVPVRPLIDLVSIYTMGAAKYDDRNWEKGMSWMRVLAAVERHILAFKGGEDMDPESGLPHMAHAAWGCFALLEFMRTQKTFDDRPRDIREDDF